MRTYWELELSLTLPNQYLVISINDQSMCLLDHGQIVNRFCISTAANGPGEQMGSEKTPRGWHKIRAKIGEGQPPNTVFVGRRPTGEIYTPQLAAQHPNKDWILTRILWLCGLERGKNRLGAVDSMRRYIYIHGTPEQVKLGIPNSKGCIRMHNDDLMQVFDWVEPGTQVLIEE